MRIEREFRVDFPPEAIWPILANTDSLNREVDLPPVNYEFQPQDDGGTRVIARASAFGSRLEWVEHPFEWIALREYSVERIFRRGPIARIHTGARFVRDGNGTNVQGFVDYEPKGLLGRLAGKVGIEPGFKKLVETRVGFERYLRKEANNPYPRRTGRDPFHAPALEQARAKLSDAGADMEIGRMLAEHLQVAPEEEVTRMRPFEWADRWKVDRFECLRTFLLATRAGLVDMSWNVVCPTCRGVKNEFQQLNKLSKDAHCDSCNLNFDANFDRAVEVRFTVNSSIRSVKREKFCFGGPMNTPHILVQQRLRPKEEREIEVFLPTGDYIVRGPQTKHSAEFVVTSGAEEMTIDFARHEVRASEKVAGSRLKIRMKNGDDAERLLRIERQDWTDFATSASMVSTMQDFRDLFSREFLAPGEELAIQSLTLLFTDLKGSTELYETVGDADAYVIVRDHFRALTQVIKSHRGGVVKTMGDAIMAAFLSPEDAVRSAIEIQKQNQHGDTVIKLGLHTGPCIAVTSNEALDYFGSTVNLAQRVQSQSDGNDLTLTPAILERDGARKLLDDAGARIEAFDTDVKGFRKKVTLLRATFPWSETS